MIWIDQTGRFIFMFAKAVRILSPGEIEILHRFTHSNYIQFILVFVDSYQMANIDSVWLLHSWNLSLHSSTIWISELRKRNLWRRRGRGGVLRRDHGEQIEYCLTLRCTHDVKMCTPTSPWFVQVPTKYASAPMSHGNTYTIAHYVRAHSEHWFTHNCHANIVLWISCD